MKNFLLTSLAVMGGSMLTLVPLHAEYLVVSSSLDADEQEGRLTEFSESLNAYGKVGLHRASNGAATVAVACKDKADAQKLRDLLISRELAPADSYVVSNDKLTSMDTTAAKRVYIQAAARRDRLEAVDFARQLYNNAHWNGEVQVWASEPDANDKRWFRVVIPGNSPDKAEILQTFLKSENVIDGKSYITESSKLGLKIFSTDDG
jgi:hypothetical protein